MADRRVDPLTGHEVWVVGSRQARPNLPSTGCPFCPGGIEAPEDYDVRWFRNRWPAMPDNRCEVVLYTPDHDATFASLGVAGARKVVDLWAERTAELGARDDVAYVLVFENRGADVGATIPHPHGQIYAYDEVPRLVLAERDVMLDPIDDRLVTSADGWRAWVPSASMWPIAVLCAPDEPVPDLPSLDDRGRNGLAALLVDVFDRLDRLYDRPLPYMLWFRQRPTDGRPWDARLAVHVVSPWRSDGVQRFMAAAEQAAGVYFNPVIPEVLAEQLRALA